MINFLKIPIHCFLIPIFLFIVYIFNNHELLNFEEIIITLSFFIIIIFVSWLLLKKIIKNDNKAGLLISFSLLIIFSYGPIYDLIDDIVWGSFYIRHQYVLASFLVVFGIVSVLMFRRKSDFNKLTKISNIVIVSLIFLSISFEIEVDENINRPNIYYIILDSYAHSSIFKEVYDYDNEKLIKFLKEKNFYIASESHSNYNQSFLSYDASLNMKYVNYLADELGVDERNFHKPYEMVDSNDVMKIFKEKGYHIVNFASTDGVTGNLEIADINLCEKNKILKSQVSIMIIRQSIMNPFYDTLFIEPLDIDREWCVFEELTEIEEKIEKPVFVFAHILLPHGPWRFNSDGEMQENVPPWGNEDQNKKGYLDQSIFVEQEIMKIVDEILKKSDGSSIIILQSDTGTSLYSDNKDENIKRKMRILNAYYLPNNETSKLYDNITPVNSFRIILNQYFNENYPLLDDKMYYSDSQTELNFTDVTKFLEESRMNK
jgi:hypothetical protein